MNKQCETVRPILVEGSGVLDGLDPTVGDHLKNCEECRQVAAAEVRLADILESASPPSDPALQRQVVQAVHDLEVRRRKWALAPVAASVIFLLAGVGVLGGVPGASMVAAFPSWTSSGWLALAGSAMDLVGALRAVAVGLSVMISWPAVVAALGFSVAGIGSIALISKRWRRRAAWSDRT